MMGGDAESRHSEQVKANKKDFEAPLLSPKSSHGDESESANSSNQMQVNLFYEGQEKAESFKEIRNNGISSPKNNLSSPKQKEREMSEKH